MKKQNLIATKKFVLTVIILFLVLLALGVYPYLKWEYSAIPIYIWAFLVIGDVLGLLFITIYQLGAKQANEKAHKYNKLRISYKELKDTNEKNRKKAAEIDRIETEKKSLEAEKSTLEVKLIKP